MTDFDQAIDDVKRGAEKLAGLRETGYDDSGDWYCACLSASLQIWATTRRCESPMMAGSLAAFLGVKPMDKPAEETKPSKEPKEQTDDA